MYDFVVRTIVNDFPCISLGFLWLSLGLCWPLPSYVIQMSNINERRKIQRARPQKLFAICILRSQSEFSLNPGLFMMYEANSEGLTSRQTCTEY